MLFLRHTGFDGPRKIRRGGNADEPLHPLWPCADGQKRQPSPHRRSHQQQRAFGDPVYDIQNILKPHAYCGFGKSAAGRTVPSVIKTYEGLAPAFAQVLQKHCLGPLHIRTKTAQKHHARSPSDGAGIGQRGAVRAVENVKIHENLCSA